MHKNKILQELISDRWAIAERSEILCLQAIEKLIRGEENLFQSDDQAVDIDAVLTFKDIRNGWINALPRLESNDGNIYSVYDDEPITNGLRLVIPINGIITKSYWYYAAIGTDLMASLIKNCQDDDRIDEIILKIDSPGGMVSGTYELAKCISESKKKVVAMVGSQAASAAYWIASACSEVILESNLSQVGSIGYDGLF
jgi:ClpP class serine protease